MTGSLCAGKQMKGQSVPWKGTPKEAANFGKRLQQFILDSDLLATVAPCQRKINCQECGGENMRMSYFLNHECVADKPLRSIPCPYCFKNVSSIQERRDHFTLSHSRNRKNKESAQKAAMQRETERKSIQRAAAILAKMADKKEKNNECFLMYPTPIMPSTVCGTLVITTYY